MKYLTTKQLKALGWTAGMIKLLGHRHTTIDAGIFHGGDGFKSRIFSNAWSADHVTAIQNSDDWQYLNDRRLRRKTMKEGKAELEILNRLFYVECIGAQFGRCSVPFETLEDAIRWAKRTDKMEARIYTNNKLVLTVNSNGIEKWEGEKHA